MNQQLRSELESLLSDKLGASLRIVHMSPVGGGCINDAHQLDVSDGKRLFAKFNRSSFFSMFEAEALGLKLLRDTNSIRVPEVIVEPFRIGSQCGLVLEMIETENRPRDFETEFAYKLADLHRASFQSPREGSAFFGLDHDNFIGSTPQPNSQSTSWIDFFRERRLTFQLDLAKQNGLADASLLKLGDALCQKLDELLLEPSQASLIHGDLWSGNYLCDQQGRPAIIDPAVYGADREAEFGMITLFGGVGNRFYDAYNEAMQLEDGYSERFQIYKLYHVLNHLNLFGSSYLSQCKAILRKFV